MAADYLINNYFTNYFCSFLGVKFVYFALLQNLGWIQLAGCFFIFKSDKSDT